MNEIKPLNLCALCVSLENHHRDWLAQPLLQSVFKLYIPLSSVGALAAPQTGCCTAARNERRGVGLG